MRRITTWVMVAAVMGAVAGCGQPQHKDEQVPVFTELPSGEEPLADVRSVDPRIRVAIRYATPENFTGKALYPANLALVRESVARRLKAVQDELVKLKLGLKVYDAYRPWSIQCIMWEAVPNEDFVASPIKGSRHNRGAAVDVTLVDANGKELPMPSVHDEFTERSRADYQGGSRVARRNRNFLIRTMRHQGFEALPSEWWHFDAPGWEKYSVLDVPLTDIRPATRPAG